MHSKIDRSRVEPVQPLLSQQWAGRLHFDVLTRDVQHFSSFLCCVCGGLQCACIKTRSNAWRPSLGAQLALASSPEKLAHSTCVRFISKNLLAETDIVVMHIQTSASILTSRLRPPISGVVPLTSLALFVPFGLGGTIHGITSVRCSKCAY